MRSSILIFVALFMAPVVYAQPEGFSKVSDEAGLKVSLQRSAAALQSFSSPFVQEKTMALLSNKTVARGSFWYKNADKVRMEYTSPYHYLMVLNKGKVYVKDAKGAGQRQGRAFKQINQMISESVNGSALSNKDFAVSVYENKSYYLMQMRPLNKQMQRFVQTVEVRLTRVDMLVESILMTEPGGDNTLIKFTGRKVNQPVDESLFQQAK